MINATQDGTSYVSSVLKGTPLPREFYSRNTSIVARELLGCFLVKRDCNGILAGKIVETEAYFGKNDPASHSCKGMTPRNSVMFGMPGFTYIYFIYGNHYLLNIVAEKKGIPGAVLIRALEPVAGIDEMKINRGGLGINLLTNGPGRLTKALEINKSHNSIDVTKGDIYVVDKNESLIEIASSKRIGINKGKEMELRYFVKDNPFVSRG